MRFPKDISKGAAYIKYQELIIFTKNCITELNIYSAECVGASSVNMFQYKFDTRLRRAGYILYVKGSNSR